jgi:hypothetical protein
MSTEVVSGLYDTGQNLVEAQLPMYERSVTVHQPLFGHVCHNPCTCEAM